MNSGMKKGILFVSVCAVSILILYAVWPSKMIDYLTTPASTEGDMADARFSTRSSNSAPIVIRKKIPGGLQEVEASYDRKKPVVITKKIPSDKSHIKKKIKIRPSNDISPLPAAVSEKPEQKPSIPTSDVTSAETGPEVNPEPMGTEPADMTDLPEGASSRQQKQPAIIAKTKKQDSKQAPVTLTGKTVESKAGQEFAPRPYSIMLASCRRMESAQTVIKQNRIKGLFPYAVRVDLGQKGIWWRVFEGNYTSSVEANGVKSQHKLDKAMVKKTPYAISIGAYENETDAAAEVQRLIKLKHSPYFLPGPENKIRLLVGAFVSKDGARQLQDELTARGISNQVVIR